MKLLIILLLIETCGDVLSQITTQQYCNLWDSIKKRTYAYPKRALGQEIDNINPMDDQQTYLSDIMNILNKHSALLEEVSKQKNDSEKYITCRLENDKLNQVNLQLLGAIQMFNGTLTESKESQVQMEEILNLWNQSMISLTDVTASNINLEKEQQAQMNEILSLRNQSQKLNKTLADNKNLARENQIQADEILSLRNQSLNLENFLTESKIEIQRLENVTAQLNESIQLQGQHFDCADLYKSGYRVSGDYKAYLQGLSTNVVRVYCDMTTSGGGWTVFQRRYNGSVPFNRTWEEYKNGFGNILGEHWLGIKYISMMTNSLKAKYRLRVDLTAFDGRTSYAEYTDFKVDSESEKYRLSIDTYSGTAGDGGNGLSYHNNQYFSTRDRDNDQDSSGHCSQQFGYGGFWYKNCHHVNLNGLYRINSTNSDGIRWYAWLWNQVLQATIMMFRPMNFP